MNDILEQITCADTTLNVDQVVEDRISEAISELQYAVKFSPTETLKRAAQTLQGRLFSLRAAFQNKTKGATIATRRLTKEDYEWVLSQLGLLHAQFDIAATLSTDVTNGEENVFSTVMNSTVDNLQKLNYACKYITGQFRS